MICEKCGFKYEGEKCPVCYSQKYYTAKQRLATKDNEAKTYHGLVGMILGIVSFFAFGLYISIPGLILSIIGLKKNKNDGFAVAGLVTSIISTVMGLIALAIALIPLVLVIAYFLIMVIIYVIVILYMMIVSLMLL